MQGFIWEYYIQSKTWHKGTKDVIVCPDTAWLLLPQSRNDASFRPRKFQAFILFLKLWGFEWGFVWKKQQTHFPCFCSVGYSGKYLQKEKWTQKVPSRVCQRPRVKRFKRKWPMGAHFTQINKCPCQCSLRKQGPKGLWICLNPDTPKGRKRAPAQKYNLNIKY